MSNEYPHQYKYLVRDSLRVIRTKLGLRKQTQIQIPAEKTTDLDKTLEPKRPTYRDVGFRDAIRAGWYKNDTQELFDGFPINEKDTVIDVGCGFGNNLKFCAKYAAHTIGVDIDPSRVEATAELLKKEGAKSFKTIASDGNPLPIDTASIDKIICTEVLEHVDDPAITMKELVRIGKPGALYFLSVPGAASERVLKKVAPALYFEKPNHIRIFDSEGFETLVKDAGLEIEKHCYFSFFWAVWHAIVWKCGIDYDNGSHPALDHWAQAWDEVLSLPEGKKCMEALDEALHKSQIIIARKPLTGG